MCSLAAVRVAGGHVPDSYFGAGGGSGCAPCWRVPIWLLDLCIQSIQKAPFPPHFMGAGAGDRLQDDQFLGLNECLIL